MVNRSVASIALALAGAILSSAAVGQEQQWLSYRTAPLRELYERIPFDPGQLEIACTEQAPQGVALPKFQDKTPLFAQWKTPWNKAGQLHLALERSKANGAYDRLYIDTNGDGSLADEKPQTAGETRGWDGDYCMAMYKPVSLVFQSEDGPITYDLSLYYRGLRGRNLTAREGITPAPHVLMAMASGWYEGQVSIGGKNFRCWRLDHNANGVFDDTGLDPKQTDRVVLQDANKPADVRWAGKYMQVGDRLYRMNLARDGAWIAFSPAGDVPMGALRVPEGITQVSLQGENGLFKYTPQNALVKAPAGKQLVHEYVLTRKAKAGAAWTFTGQNLPLEQAFTLEPGQERTLALGEQIEAGVDLQRAGNEVYFNYKISGGMGESVNLTRGGQPGPAPKLRIVSDDGKYDKTFKFEYG